MPNNLDLQVVAARVVSSGAMASDQPIRYVLLVDFHHKLGPRIEYLVPDSDRLSGDRGRTVNSHAAPLPAEWASVPFLAMPDGAHRWLHDAAYFTVAPSEWNQVNPRALRTRLTRPECALWRGVHPPNCSIVASSCGCGCHEKYRPEERLCSLGAGNTDPCTAHKQPLFGLLYDHVASTTEVLFAQKDFSEKELLDSLYQRCVAVSRPHRSLVQRFAVSKPNLDEYIFTGCNLRPLVLDLRHGLVQLFKALLLHKR